MRNSVSPLALSAACFALLTLAGCALVEPPPLTAGHPASLKTAEGARPQLPPLGLDETTRGTQRRLAGADAGAGMMMQHGGMDHSQMERMDHSKMEDAKSEMGASHRANPPGTDTAPAQFYTCPMHAQIKESKPGNCPICGMTLIKKQTAVEHNKMEENQ